ncbi:unnamed protein product [Paramecium octaurelia]|uniref:DUSP domain-containing protein n=1 Tax=Paramecium octaurelia TaxID=43137 RepID=A0A8S1XEM3_PAROT|nr:unnamed protein product [Paramecium octaurelia]
MFDQDFIHQYRTLNTLIKEGYAFAISTQWFRQFNNYLQNPNGVNISKIGEINNQNICDLNHAFQPNVDGYSIPQQHSMTFSRIYQLKSNVKYGQDYEIISIEIWSFLKLYYSADYEVIVFVTQILPNLTNYFTCENLDQGVCICTEVFYLVLVVVQPHDKGLMMAIKVPACPWIKFDKFRKYIYDMLEHKINLKTFNNKAHMYYNGKKVPFKGNKTLQEMEITKEMQIMISCQSLINGDVEEEIETDEDEDDQEIEKNLHTKQEFLQILEQALNQQSTELLTLKSIEEIQQCLEQNDFFQI